MKQFLAEVRQIPSYELESLQSTLATFSSPFAARLIVCLALEPERRKYVEASGG